MRSIKTKIYFVLDTNWKKDVYTVSREYPVWICNSKSNDIQINDVWKKDNNSYHPNKGVTAFKIKDTIEDTFYNTLGVIDDHHQSGYSNVNAWNKIYVFGLEFQKVRKTEIEEILGFEVQVNVLDDCFEIIKNDVRTNG